MLSKLDSFLALSVHSLTSFLMIIEWINKRKPCEAECLALRRGRAVQVETEKIYHLHNRAETKRRPDGELY